MTRYTWSQAVWRAKLIAKQIGRTVFVVEHDGQPDHARFSISRTGDAPLRLVVGSNGNTW